MIITSSLIFYSFFIFPIILLYLSYKYLFKEKKKKNYIIISDYESFTKFSKDLNNSKQIGVDTEHFQDNTYKGILCLIQLHIPKYSFGIIIDLIELRKEEKIFDKNI